MDIRRILLVLAAALPVLPAGAGTPGYVEGEVLVRFRRNTSLQAAENTARARGAAVARRYRWLSKRRGQAYVLLRDSRRTTQELIAQLSADPSVDVVVPNYRRPVRGSKTPNDPLYPQLWGLLNTGQTVNGSAGIANADINHPEALALSIPTNAEVVVGVLDTGVDYTHPDLAANLWINVNENPTNRLDNDGNGYTNDYYGYDFAGDYTAVSVPDSDPMDVDIDPGHGTHCSGTIAATMNNGLGVAGVAPRAKIMALKVSDDGYYILDAAALAAVEYATAMKLNGVNIVSLNASYSGGAASVIERDAIAEAGNAGILFCAAAGNDGVNVETTLTYPVCYTLSNIIGVAATDSSDALASFSNYGTTSVDLAAPGVNVLSTVPAHLTAVGRAVTTGGVHVGAGFTFAGLTTGLTARVYNCGLGYPGDFPAEVAGNIALILRGTIQFTAKTSNAMAAGASAAIIYNNVAGTFAGTLQRPQRWIPAIAVTKAAGTALLAVTSQVTVVNWSTNAFGYLDGTSMATPHVAGAVGLIALSYPDETVTQRAARLVSHVTPLAGLATKVRFGGRLNLQRAIDTDADDLPDWWELDYEDSLAAMSAATDDDGDLMTARQEYLSDTSPLDGLSYLHVTNATLNPDGAAVLQWPSGAERTYEIRRAADLPAGFAVIATNVPATPPGNTYTDASPAAAQSYYTILVE